MIIKDFEATRKAIPVRTFTNFANGSWLKMFGFTALSVNLNYKLIWFYPLYFIYLFIYLLFSHNKDYTSITLYKDVARGPQKTTRLVRGGPLVTIILSNRTITTKLNLNCKRKERFSDVSTHHAITGVQKNNSIGLEFGELVNQFVN